MEVTPETEPQGSAEAAPASPPSQRSGPPKTPERVNPTSASRPIPTPPPVTAPSEVLMGTPVDVPPFEQFSFQAANALSPQDLQVITTFHEQYMQAPGIGNDRAKFLQARRDAEVVKPLLERQYTLACQGVGGAQSGEARTVEVNLAWVKQLLEMPG